MLRLFGTYLSIWRFWRFLTTKQSFVNHRLNPYPFNKADEFQRKDAKAQRRKEDLAHASPGRQMVSGDPGAKFLS
jgi:hypothetical protein